ncbi:MAG TPA: hypothetical protein VGD27_00405 [Longimicrobiales bacterium]
MPAVRGTFRFESFGSLNIDDIEYDVPKQHYYDAMAMVQRLRALGNKSPDAPPLLLGLTSVPLAQQERAADVLEWDYDYFGVWPPLPGGQPIDGPVTAGVVSTNLWVRRYERSAYRTTEQYVEHIIVAFLGDTLARGVLTHARFRRCVFDYNEDLDSIIDSVRGASLCKECTARLSDERQLGPLAAQIGGQKLSAAMQAILKDVSRPRTRIVLQVLQEDATFSIVILGVLAAIGVNLLSGWLAKSPFKISIAITVLAFGLLFGWGVWRYFRRGPPLR